MIDNWWWLIISSLKEGSLKKQQVWNYSVEMAADKAEIGINIFRETIRIIRESYRMAPIISNGINVLHADITQCTV